MELMGSHHRLSSIAALVASVIASIGCKPHPTRAPGNAPPAGRCSRMGATSNNLPMNNLPMNNLPMNGLSQKSLAENKALLEVLASSPLRSNLLQDPKLATALAAEYAPDLVKYIASCALDPCDWIDAPEALAKDPNVTLADYSAITGDEADRKRRGFIGELGLCGANRRDSWRTQRPSTACLQRVSACMLARTNALQAKVMISLRGDGMDLADRVPVNTLYRENSGTAIASFSPRASCSPLELSNPHGNCGWQPLLVGQCAYASTPRRVSLAATDLRDGIELRVCAGIYGCDDLDGQPITVVNGSKQPPAYAGGLKGAGQGEVTFPCPDNGPPDKDGHATGYFAVMARPRDGRVLAADAVRARFASPGYEHDHYPAAEADVFTYREGSFFGNLFVRLPPHEERRPIMLGGDQFACFSSMWTEGVAMFDQRICANVTKALPDGCFANVPGPCDAHQDPSPPHCPGGMPCLGVKKTMAGECTPTTGPAPIASRCRSSVSPVLAGAGRPWPYPYTTYLNQPCDLAGPRCVESHWLAAP